MISIVTPSFQMLPWLRRCCLSIADQEIPIQHVIQDGGTPEVGRFNSWLSDLDLRYPNYRPTLISKPDEGMYDALNCGLQRRKFEICAHLNCDEQYLPGALRSVCDYFHKNPNIDIVFGDVLIFSQDSKPLCYRKAVTPRPSVIRSSHLPTFTCATFFRSHILDKVPYRTDLKAIADAYWILDLLEAGVPMRRLGFATSAFYNLESNLSKTEVAQNESDQLRISGGITERVAGPLIKIGHRIEKALAGCYWPPSGVYPVYTDSSSKRTPIEAFSPSGVLRELA